LRRPHSLAVLSAAALVWGACATFTRPPRTCDSRKLVCIEAVAVKAAEGDVYWLTSPIPGSVTVTIDSRTRNLDSSADFPMTMVLRGPFRRKLAVMMPIKETESWDSTYSFDWRFGDMNAKHDDAVVYDIPFAPGFPARVNQGYHGRRSHTAADEYAVDFAAVEGTPVHAARGGVVVDVVQKYKKGSTSTEFDEKANLVFIEHADHTLGEYIHLRYKGSAVKVGQKVTAGELIGYSGNTGHTTGPHLHFGVYTAVDAKTMKSLPVKFAVGGSAPEELREGQVYQRN
jgi:murein DD-endopeptidase MepM/ murein hydrolase activator NlpD